MPIVRRMFDRLASHTSSHNIFRQTPKRHAPSPSDMPEPKSSTLPSPSGAELKSAILTQRQAFWQAGGFSWLTSLLVLVPVVFMFQVYGRVVDSQSLTTLFWLLVLVSLAYGVMEVLDWSRLEVMREASAEFDLALAPRVFDITFELNRSRGTSGNAQPMTDLKTIREFFYSPLLMALFETPMALVFLLLMFALHPLLGVVTLAGAVVQLGIGWGHHQRTHADLVGLSQAQVASQLLAHSSLQNAQVVQGMGMYKSLHARWLLVHEKFLQHQGSAMEHGGAFQAANKTLQLVLSSGLLGVGAWILMDGALFGGPGMLIVGSTIGARAVAPLGTLITQWRSLMAARQAYRRLDELLTQQPLQPPGMALPSPLGLLTVESLVAAAPKSNAPILRGLQFKVQPGQMLAVVGPSGSGKSTLAKLLVGLWPAMSGKVRLDSADVYKWSKAELGPHMGYVPQTVELFEGTLADNIARFEEGASPAERMQRVQEAAHASGLTDIVGQLPNSFDCRLGPEGQNLSGGQMQRVAIARAIYGNPKLLVLDEPNSHLDTQGEADLASLIAAQKNQGTTVVVMTHRKSLLALADHILVLAEGTQQLYGPRDDVLAKLGGGL